MLKASLRLRESRRRRNIAIGSLTATALLLLTAGVFSIVATSRDVAHAASSLHAHDEMLRTSAITRAQLGLGTLLTDVQTQTDVQAHAAIEAAIVDSQTSLEQLQSSTTLLDQQLNQLDDDTAVAIQQFQAASSTMLQKIASGAVPTSDDRRTFETAYNEALDAMTTGRENTIDELRDADASLSRLGGLVSFIVAFVIPSIGITVYRSLTRPSKELVLAEATLARNRVRDGLRRELLLGQLRFAGDRQQQAEHQANAGRIIRNLERIVLTIERSQHCHFCEVTVYDVVSAASRNTWGIGGEAAVDIDCSRDALAWTDQVVAEVLIESLINDAKSHLATSVMITARRVDAHVIVEISHDGLLRSPHELNQIRDQKSLADRLAILGSTDVHMTAALFLCEDLQADISVTSTDGERQLYRLSLPVATGTSEKPRPQHLRARSR